MVWSYKHKIDRGAKSANVMKCAVQLVLEENQTCRYIFQNFVENFTSLL